MVVGIVFFNPTLSITPSKPSVSSGSLFTLVNCKIYYLSHVNYDPTAADLISIRVTIYLRGGGERAGTRRQAGTGKGGRPVREEGGPVQLGLHPPPYMCNLHVLCTYHMHDQLF